MSDTNLITQPDNSSDLLKKDEAQSTSPLHRLARSSRVALSAIWARFQRLSPKVRLGVVSAGVLLIGGLVFSSVFSRSAKLNIICQHSFRAAEVSVWIDSRLIYNGNVSGSAKVPFGLFGNKKSGLAKVVNVPSGRHSIRVRLTAEAEGYDQMKTVSAVFSEDQDNSLSIGAGRRGLYLSAQGGASVPAESELGGSYGRFASSFVLSIFASGMSAAIAFIVQEFMRSQKARLALAKLPDQ
jgi:hypothetical protein